VDWLVFLVRLAITLTFIILAAGGPWALFKLSSFIRRYKTAHEELKARIQAIEKHLGITPPNGDKP
jgi:hypothetical protein